MTLAELVLLGSIVSFNDFAVALGLGAAGARNPPWTIALAFAGVGFLFPLLGIWTGLRAAPVLAGLAGPVAVVVVAGFGLWILLRSVGSEREVHAWRNARVPLLPLAVLAAGVSVDNLVVGFALGLHGLPPLTMAAVIGCVVFLWSMLGIVLGRWLHVRWERSARRVAGLLLVLLAVAMGLGWV